MSLSAKGNKHKSETEKRIEKERAKVEKAFMKELSEAGVNANSKGQVRASRRERRSYLFSTGLYAEYRALSFQQAQALAPYLEWHAHGGSVDACLEALFADRAKHTRQYRVSDEKKHKRVPVSICAHRLALAIPKGMEKYASEIAEEFLHMYDSRTRFLTWGYRLITIRGVPMAEIMLFTRPVLTQPIEKVRRWDSDYYWNTKTKKRASKEAFEKDTDGTVILRYRKGQPMLDDGGKKQTETTCVSSKEVPLFRYRPGKGQNGSLSGFEIMMERIKGSLLEVLCALGMPSCGRFTVRKCSYKKGKYSPSTLIKVRERNRLITLVNRHLNRIRMSIEAAGFEECPDVMRIWRAFHREVAHLCHAENFKYQGIRVKMNYRGFFSQFAERLSMLRSLLEEKFRVFYVEYAKIMLRYGLGTREGVLAAEKMTCVLTPSVSLNRRAHRSMELPRGEDIADLGI